MMLSCCKFVATVARSAKVLRTLAHLRHYRKGNQAAWATLAGLASSVQGKQSACHCTVRGRLKSIVAVPDRQLLRLGVFRGGP